MRKIWPLLMAGSIGAMGTQVSSAEDYQLLVGSYTAGQSQGIYRLNFDSSTGQVNPTPLQVIKSENPSWLTLSKDQDPCAEPDQSGTEPGQRADPFEPQRRWQSSICQQLFGGGRSGRHPRGVAGGR
jgi:hypothetical protein